MKKTLSLFLALSMLLTMLVIGGPVAAAASGTESPAGCYKMTGLAGSSGSNLEIISSIVDWGVKYYLILKEDGTGSMNFLEAEIPLTWDESCLILPGTGDSSHPLRIPYSFGEGSVKITTRAYSMDFSALTEEEQLYFDANGSGSLSGMIGKVVQGLVDRIDGGLIEGLLFDLALGALSDGYETVPIPEGEPTKGTVTGIVDGIEYTVLGADSVQFEGREYLIFYYDAKNVADELRAVWTYEIEAAQNGEFLEETWDLDSIIPEHFNVNYDFWPGRTVRCASVFPFDPDGGTVGLRFSTYSNHDEDSTVLYYADPRNLSGAPEEPFAFDADPAIPKELEGLPEKTEKVQIEDAELFTAEDGSPAIRFHFRFREDCADYCYVSAYQDGIELQFIWNDLKYDEEDPEDAGRLRAFSCRLRTGSPVVLAVYEDGNSAAFAARVVEIG